jgi:voltage-gated potassium channel
MVSTIMYYVEYEAQPAKFSSIPATMWWGIETLTTVGYGDMIPSTPLGRFLNGVIAVLGIGIFALPAGILSSGLTDHLRTEKSKLKRCPHCGGELPH